MSTGSSNRIRCAFCGRFISYEDIKKRKAHSVFTPDSHFTVEKMEFICEDCGNNETH